MPGTIEEFIAGVPGIYYGIPEKVYRALDACCQSDLGVIEDECEARLEYDRSHPKDREEHFEFGTAVHSLVLERKPLADTYAIGGPINQTTGKPYGADSQKFREWADAQGKPTITQAVADAAEACAKRLLEHPLAGAVLAEGAGHPEVSIVWKRNGINEDGLLCKARIDYLRSQDQIVADLKTTKCASRREFRKSIKEYKYHLQAWHYIDGLDRLGITIDQWIIVAVEKIPPYLSGTYLLEYGAIQKGGGALVDAYHRYAQSKASNFWPNYNYDWGRKEYRLEEIGLPSWAGRNESDHR